MISSKSKKIESYLIAIGIIGLNVWIFTVMFLEDFGYEVALEYDFLVIIPLTILIIGVFLRVSNKDPMMKNLRRGIIFLLLGSIGIVLWLYTIMLLRDSGQEILQPYFLFLIIPLALVVIGLGFVIYGVYLMIQVRRERVSEIEYVEYQD